VTVCLVLLKQIFSDKSFGAGLAGIWFNVRMDEEVLLIVVLVLKTFATL
jgi:hypothetical protein